MKPAKGSSVFKRSNMFIIYGAVIAAALLVLFTGFFQHVQVKLIPVLAVLIGIITLAALLVILSIVLRILDTIDSSSKLDEVCGEVTKMRELLAQVKQGTHLTETAKAIAFRDAERQTLQDVVFDKLQQKEFDTAYEIIDEIAHRTGYNKLAEQLKNQADKYHDATDAERMSQVIAHVDKLLENHQWAKAAAHIDRLMKADADSEKVKQLHQKLMDKKAERKKVLLNAWDEAVKRQATDRSLEILRELDQYLTPNEGLALQEAARDVFRTKLHNLGVQFSLAVSGKQWTRALDAGEAIIRDFPNSRMAEEIREKIHIVRQNAGRQQPKTS